MSTAISKTNDKARPSKVKSQKSEKVGKPKLSLLRKKR